MATTLQLKDVTDCMTQYSLLSSCLFSTEEPQQETDPPPCVRQCLPEIKTTVMRTQERIHRL